MGSLFIKAAVQTTDTKPHNNFVDKLVQEFNCQAPHLLNKYQINSRNDITHHQDPCCFGIYCMDSRCSLDVSLQGHLPGIQTFITTPAAIYNFGKGNACQTEFASIAFFLSNYNIQSVVIVPHTKCGAATAAFNYYHKQTPLPPGISDWIQTNVPKEIALSCQNPNQLAMEMGKITKQSVQKVIDKLNESRPEDNKLNIPITVWIHDLDEYKIKPVE